MGFAVGFLGKSSRTANLISQANMLQKNKTPRSWINHQIKYILLAFIAVLFVLMTICPIATLSADYNTVTLIVNGLFLIICLVVVIMMVIEGIKVMKLVKTLELDQQLLKTVTKLVIGSSVSLLVVMLVLIITSLASVVDNDTDICMVSTFFYRALEIGVMTLLAYPLRKIETSAHPTPSGVEVKSGASRASATAA